MASSQASFLLGLGVVLIFIATPVAAFGAGDIAGVSNLDGVNYRHGDIENTLLELIVTAGSNTKFSKLDIKRVYFGNWLRDYSQAIDVGGLKQLPAETIRILLWCLSFITFGYATAEFEVTAERLGCYRPEEHIDNPKDYADNEDARPYDSRLRGPVDEGKELAVDHENGLKVYIASENAGIETSAGLVRRLLEKSIELGRRHHKDNNDKDAFFEALRLLGTGLHCLEDFSAHSNYTELALKELGVDAFPHVGKATEIDVKGKKVFPVVTGTFGMTDFLHSVVGELGDKVAQSEVEDMESKLDSASAEDDKNDEKSILKEILDKIPWDLLEGDAKPDGAKADELKAASTAKAEEAKNNPADPNVSLGGVDVEEAKRVAQQTLKDMYPILEFSDQVNKAVTRITSKVPGLDELSESITGALSIFIFSLLAPFVKPIIAHARVELKSTSEGVLKSSMKGQYAVFENDQSTDPTHSMLSKDHFSNVLNPIAGKVACATVKFVVPLIVEAWSDEGKDVRQVIDEVLQVFHHPALRDENKAGQKAMFETVKKWWEDKDETEQNHYKEILTFDGVKEGKNHEGDHDDGHSHGAPVKNKNSEAQEGATLISGLAGGLTNLVLGKTGLDKKFGIDTSEKKTSSSRPQRTEEATEEETPSYNRPQKTAEKVEESSYGNTSSYGRKNEESESTSYGGNTSSSYGGGQDTETPSYGSSGRHGRKTEEETETSSYGQQTSSSSYGRTQDTETSSYSSGRHGRQTEEETETSSYGGGGNTSSYGRTQDTETPSYSSGRQGRQTEEESETPSYSSGRHGRNNEEETETSSYGGGGNTSSYGRTQDTETETPSYSSGRQNRNDDNETSSYGGGGRQGRSNDDETTETSYGSRRNDESEETSYGSSGRNTNTYGQDRSDETEGYGGSNRRY